MELRRQDKAGNTAQEETVTVEIAKGEREGRCSTVLAVAGLQKHVRKKIPPRSTASMIRSPFPHASKDQSVQYNSRRDERMNNPATPTKKSEVKPFQGSVSRL
jgi:hypothetical protein